VPNSLKDTCLNLLETAKAKLALYRVKAITLTTPVR
jgi:hypothetical protein